MTPSSAPRALREVALLLGVRGAAALVAAALAVITLVSVVVPLAQAVLVPGAILGETRSADAERVQRFESDIDGHIAQISGRSMFFVPSAPPPPAPAQVGDVARPERAPSRYEGPAIVAMINGVVWFADGRRIAVEDESDSSLGVVSISAPWSARVLWRGVEFDVPLFERTTSRFIEAPPAPDSGVSSANEVTEVERSSAATPQEAVKAEGEAKAPQEKDPA